MPDFPTPKQPDIPPPKQPYPDEVLADLASVEEGREFDPTFGGAAVLALFPVGSDAELVRRVRDSLGKAIAGSDDPPVVLLVPDDVDLGEEEPDDDGRRELWAPAIPLVVYAGKKVIEHVAREAAHQQRMDHAAHQRQMREVEADLKRAAEWRKKTVG